MSTKIFLVGMPGSGKSTIGALLSRSLQCDFIDLDSAIEKKHGQKISKIFAEKGEAHFREIETLALQQIITETNDLVVSTGGGIVTQEVNRIELLGQKYVVYLKSNVEVINNRTAGDKTRPLLQCENPLEKIRQLHYIREPLYMEVAKFKVDTTAYEPTEVINLIIGWLENKLNN